LGMIVRAISTLARDPMDFLHPFLAPFRDDPDLTTEGNLVSYWQAHDLYFARCMDDLARRKARGYVVPVASDKLVAELAKIIPWLPGREAEYREWVGVTHGRGAMAWVIARRGGCE
jgi:hypothetical protein